MAWFRALTDGGGSGGGSFDTHTDLVADSPANTINIDMSKLKFAMNMSSSYCGVLYKPDGSDTLHRRLDSL